MIVVTGATHQGPIWTVMDNGGVKAGDVMLDIDAVSGAILHKTSQR